jgi:hypothetical protein
VKKKRFDPREDGTCQHECDICRASCAPITFKCERWINHSENGHVCAVHHAHQLRSSEGGQELTV